jgi:hypothetical protein
MLRDPRMKHLQRLHRQRSRAAGRFFGEIPQRSQPRDAGRMLLALVLLGIIGLLILGVLLAVPGQGEVRAWVHQVTHSLHEDRVGMLPPPEGR